MKQRELERLAEIARKARVAIVRMTAAAGSGHPGGSLSAVEILTYLYFKELRLDPADPQKAGRDRFVLSKGHGAPALYAILALRGFFPEEILTRLRKIDSPLQGHPHRLDIPGVEASTGSLGQGLSIANGMAMGYRMSGATGRVYALIGDGESQEGQIWEAAMTAGFHKLSNLCVFLDYNNLQIDGRVSDIKDIAPIRAKWEAFNWNVEEIDGHDFRAIERAVRRARRQTQMPTMIVARTVKGKGISFMENRVEFHGLAPTQEELVTALRDLSDG